MRRWIETILFVGGFSLLGLFFLDIDFSTVTSKSVVDPRTIYIGPGSDMFEIAKYYSLADLIKTIIGAIVGRLLQCFWDLLKSKIWKK